MQLLSFLPRAGDLLNCKHPNCRKFCREFFLHRDKARAEVVFGFNALPLFGVEVFEVGLGKILGPVLGRVLLDPGN